MAVGDQMFWEMQGFDFAQSEKDLPKSNNCTQILLLLQFTEFSQIIVVLR